jgi:hypothetical protein
MRPKNVPKKLFAAALRRNENLETIEKTASSG